MQSAAGVANAKRLCTQHYIVAGDADEASEMEHDSEAEADAIRSFALLLHSSCVSSTASVCFFLMLVM